MNNDKIKLIIADDHPVFRGGMETLLKSMPFVSKVSQAAHGEEVIRLLDHEHYDLVLMDLKMSPMNGIETTETICGRYPDTKVIALSMHDDEKSILDVLSKGAVGYLVKNADPEEIKMAIKEVIAGNKYFSKEVSKVLYGLVGQIKQAHQELESDEILQKERYREIVFLLCNGFTSSETANIVFLSKRTVDDYRQMILHRTKSKNVLGLFKYATDNGILDDDKLKRKFEKHLMNKNA